jgi:biopolymer transport protein ExbD
VHPGSGLEGAPDIMLLTMAGLMVAIVWLVAQAHEATLPEIDLPQSDASRLGETARAALYVSLRPGPGGLEVWIEGAPVPGGIAGLEQALSEAGAGSVTLRADASTPWEDGLAAMSAAARLGLPVSVAAER